MFGGIIADHLAMSRKVRHKNNTCIHNRYTSTVSCFVPHSEQNLAVARIFAPHSVQNVLSSLTGPDAVALVAGSCFAAALATDKRSPSPHLGERAYLSFHLSTRVTTSDMLSRLTSIKSFMICVGFCLVCVEE